MTSVDEQLKNEMVGVLPKLRSFARGLTGDRALADDLVQNVCERALIKIKQFSPGTRLDSWLYRIAYTQWHDHLRRQKRRSLKLIQLYDHLHGQRKKATQGSSSSSPGRMLDIKKALCGLPEDQRAALTLVTIAGFNYDEAADILDLPVGTVASRVARARQKMAKLLSENVGSLPPRQDISRYSNEQGH